MCVIASHALLHQTPLRLAIKLKLFRHNGISSIRMASFVCSGASARLSAAELHARELKVCLLRCFSIRAPDSSSARCCAFSTSADDTLLHPRWFGRPVLWLQTRTDLHSLEVVVLVARRFRRCISTHYPCLPSLRQAILCPRS